MYVDVVPSQRSGIRPKPAPEPVRAASPVHLSRLQEIPVASIRPEEGLGRQRDSDGHRELRRSIQRFGVLTPITVRPAPDNSNQYLLIKGQGRTLACRMLGIETIPAIIVDSAFGDEGKVQQFLVENVARLKMRPIDRALLIARARQEGEETASVAQRFGVSAATVRRLQYQLEHATQEEVAALRSGKVNLTVHAVIARHVDSYDREAVMNVVAQHPLSARDLDALFRALDWRNLSAIGPGHQESRIRLLDWACATLRDSHGGMRERLGFLAESLPVSLSTPLDLNLESVP